MEVKTQIIVAVFTSLAGILLGIFLVVLAVCYRRRSLSASPGDVVSYRTHNRHVEADDQGSVYVGQRHNRSYKKNPSSSIDRISEQYERENLTETRPTLHQTKWNKKSSRNNRRSSDKRQGSNNENDNRTAVDFRTDIQNMHIPRPHMWSVEKGKDLVTHSNRRRHSDSFEMRQIPRPIVRPYKNELFEDTESTYDCIHLVDQHTIDMTCHRSSKNVDFD